MDKIIHAISPVAVIAAAVALAALGKISGSDAVTIVTSAGGVGVLAVRGTSAGGSGK